MKHATGNADGPGIDNRFQRPHALSLRTVGSNISGHNSRSNPNTATDDNNDNDDNDDNNGNDSGPETQSEGHGLSQLSVDIDESQCLPTQTPFTTMDNSRVLEHAAAPLGRPREIKAQLERLESIIQTPSIPAAPNDDGAGPPEETQNERTDREATPPRPVSGFQFAPPKEGAPSPAVKEVLRVAQTPELPGSTVQPTNTTTTPGASERRATFMGSKRLGGITTVLTNKTKRAYHRVRLLFKRGGNKHQITK